VGAWYPKAKMMGRFKYGPNSTRRGVKRSKCPHRFVYRERGPTTEKVLVKDSDNEGNCKVIEGEVLVVWEVCVKCKKRKKIGFQKGVQ
jgi:hypothetical protein